MAPSTRNQKHQKGAGKKVADKPEPHCEDEDSEVNCAATSTESEIELLKRALEEERKKVLELTEETRHKKVRVVQRGEAVPVSAYEDDLENADNSSPSKDKSSPSAEKSGSEKTKKKHKREEDLSIYQIDLLKTAVKRHVFSYIKFGQNLDLRDKALEVAKADCRIKEHRLESFAKSVERHMVRLTTIQRCAVLRAFRAKFRCTYKLLTCVRSCM